MLSDHQIERYSRQIVLPELGGRGQQTLLSAAVAVIGSGTLSTAALTYLAAAGVGRLTVVAPELCSQIEALNPDCHTSTLSAPFTDVSALEVAGHCDAVLACGATPELCTLLNAACVAQRTPIVWADSAGALGLVTVLVGWRQESPCYMCVARDVSRLLAAGDAAHVLAEAAAVFIGTVQATETVKLLADLGAIPAAQLLRYDAAAGTAEVVPLKKDPRCPTCGVPRR